MAVRSDSPFFCVGREVVEGVGRKVVEVVEEDADVGSEREEGWREGGREGGREGRGRGGGGEGERVREREGGRREEYYVINCQKLLLLK